MDLPLPQTISLAMTGERACQLLLSAKRRPQDQRTIETPETGIAQWFRNS